MDTLQLLEHGTVEALELDELAWAANLAADRAEQSAGESVRQAVAAGLALIEAKSKVPHGEWIPWLRAHWRRSIRVAQRYVQLARATELPACFERSLFNEEEGEEEGKEPIDRAASIREAVRLLSPLALENEAEIEDDEGWERAEEEAAAEGEAEGGGTRHNVGSNSAEWYTPEKFVERVRDCLFTIDLDPASCELAQRTVRATTYYSKEDDGLTKPWAGKVFLNPPYAALLVTKFVDKLVEEYLAGAVTEAVLLVNASTDAKWFQKAAEASAVICFPGERIAFYQADGVGTSPTHGQAFMYFGDRPGKFLAAFCDLGLCATLVSSACVFDEEANEDGEAD